MKYLLIILTLISLAFAAQPPRPKEPAVGMTFVQVRAIWGKPTSAEVEIRSNGRYEVWTYEKKTVIAGQMRVQERFVRFVNGKVVSITFPVKK